MTQDQLRRALDYDPETGVFTWKHRPEGRRSWNTRYAGDQAGTVDPRGRKTAYRIIHIHRKLYYAHRLAWLYVHGEWPQKGKEIDHRNGDGLDNRISNLRVVTSSVNKANRVHLRPDNRSGMTGVGWYAAGGRWRAHINRVHLGYFPTLLDAVAARKRAERRHFPEVFA